MKSTVLVVGAFDLLHAGHAKFLAEARSFGNELVVGVASDASRRLEKGEGHPLAGERDRAALLEFLKPVTAAYIVDEGDVSNLLERVRPHIFYTLSDDWVKGGIRKRKEASLLKSWGGKVIKVSKELPYLSSSEMVDRVADLKIRQVIEYFIGRVEPKSYSGRRSQAQYVNPKVGESVLAMGRPNVPSNLLSLMYFGKVVKSGSLSSLGQVLRARGKKIVFTALGGDLLHIGHARFLKKAAGWGDVLVVGIPSNRSMRRQKGLGRPVIDEQSRAELLCYLKGVDYVVIFDEDTVLETIEALEPDIFQTVEVREAEDVWNKDYKNSPEYQAVMSYGGRVVLCPRQAQGVSATNLINKAAKIRLEKMFRDCLK